MEPKPTTSPTVRVGSGRRATGPGQRRGQQHRRGDREGEGDPLGPVTKGVDGVGQEDVQDQEGEVREYEGLEQRPPATGSEEPPQKM